MSAVEARAEALAARTAGLLGRSPDGVWCAPGRVNLMGEHTDYNEGYVLPAAIDREALAAVAVRDDDVVTCRSLDLPGSTRLRLGELGPGALEGWPGYVLGVAWALRERGVAVPGMDLVVASDVPLGAGLSSSAALEASLAVAVAELAAADLPLLDLAVACRRAETDVVGAPVGLMDQVAALLGRAGCALLLDCRALEVDPVPLRLEEGGLALLVIDTRVAHAHAGGEYAARRRSCERAADALGLAALRDATAVQVDGLPDAEDRRRARHVVSENERVLTAADALRRGDVAALGPLFAASHASMRDDFEISCPELDGAVDASLAGGALAARMTGGGFGGCAVAVVPAQQEADVRRVVGEAFAAARYRAPRVFPVVPSDGARRVR